MPEPALSYLNGANLAASSLKPLTLIGVVAASSIQGWSSAFDGQAHIVTASGNKTMGKSGQYRFDVNPDHTHFVIYDDVTPAVAAARSSTVETGGGGSVDQQQQPQMEIDHFRYWIESLLTRSLVYYKKRVFKLAGNNCDVDLSEPLAEQRQVPMVGLVIRGDLKSIEAVEFKIKV